jgi:transcriptional regulator with XRE-family HTH domain/KaiC/GvpD/RAD55 family RecA-like ATPase
MAKVILVSTGVEWLDELLGKLRIGENVVWEIEAGTPIEAFTQAFLEHNIKGGSKAVYVSFNHSPVTMREKLGDLFDRPNFMLVDCFTDGKGHGDPVFARFYETARQEDLTHVIRVTRPADVEAFTASINEIEGEAGAEAKYVFDSLTGMQDLWADSTRAYRFFTYACPRLYDMRTIAYWILEKEAHSPSFRANLRHVTQVALDLSRAKGGHVLQVLKAEGRALSAEAEAPQSFQTDGKKLRISADGRRELLRLGKVMRSARLRRGLSQAELGEALGVTASTVSQAEHGVIALSLTNLFRLARELDIDLAAILGAKQASKKPFSVIREKDRQRVQIAGSKRKPAYIESLQELEADSDLEAMLVTIPSGVTLNRHFSLRKGGEFGLLLSGEIEVEVAGESRVLRSGDSLYLQSDTPSAWANKGAEEARLLWVIALK